MASDWTYDESTRRYRSKATGRYLSPTATRALRDDYVARQRQWADDLGLMVSSGQITVQSWELEMRQRAKLVHVAQYTFGRGGTNAITAADRAAMGALVKAQHDYLHGFARDVATGEMTEAGIRARCQKYFDSATTAYERGNAAAYGDPPLPTYPGEGTECVSGCKCAWEITESDTEWECYWQLEDGADHCGVCLDRADRYHPLILSKGG